MKTKEQVLEKLLSIAKQIDISSAGVKGISISEFVSLLWVIDVDYNDFVKDRPILKKGERDKFFQKTILKLKNNNLRRKGVKER